MKTRLFTFAALALILTYFKVPALAFALGMFIPLELFKMQTFIV